MKPIIWGAFLVLIGFVATSVSTSTGVVLVLIGGALIVWGVSKFRKPTVPLPPTAWAAARMQARTMERDAKKEARKIVRQAVKAEDSRGRAAIAAAQARLAAEAEQSWAA